MDGDRTKQEGSALSVTHEEGTHAPPIADGNDGGSSTESEYDDDDEEDSTAPLHEELADAAAAGSDDTGVSTTTAAALAPEPPSPPVAQEFVVRYDSCSCCSSRPICVAGKPVQFCMCCRVRLPLAAYSAEQRLKKTKTKKKADAPGKKFRVRRCRECQRAGKREMLTAILDEARRGAYTMPGTDRIVHIDGDDRFAEQTPGPTIEQPPETVNLPVKVVVVVVKNEEEEEEGQVTIESEQAVDHDANERKRKLDETQSLAVPDTQALRVTKKAKQADKEAAASQANDTGTPVTTPDENEHESAEQPESCVRCINQLPRVDGSRELFCACCKVKFASSAFSRSQAAKDRVIRRCRACVKGGAAIYEELKNEPALGSAVQGATSTVQTKRMAIEKQNEARAKRADDVHKLVSVKRLPRITRSKAAALKKKQQLGFAENMRKLVYGRKEYLLQLSAADKKKEVTKAEQRKDQQLHSLEKKLFVQNQQLFNELYKVIK